MSDNMFTALHTHGYMLSGVTTKEGYTLFRLFRAKTVKCDASHVTAALKVFGYAQMTAAFKVLVIANKQTNKQTFLSS